MVSVDGLRRTKAANVYKKHGSDKMSRRETICQRVFGNIIDKEESYNFRPYTYTPRGISKAQLFQE